MAPICLGKDIYNYRLTLILAGSVIFYPLLLIWQGLDLTDFGYVLTNYQNFFSGFEEKTGYGTWLTNLIGGLWLLLFGNSLGAIGIRLAGVIIFYAIVLISIKTIQPYINLNTALFLMLIVTAFRGGTFYLHYNLLTTFFYCAATYFIIKGLKDNRQSGYLFAGVMIGFNNFVRFPNILGISLVLAIIFYGYLENRPWKDIIKESLYFFCGLALALSVVLVYMAASGQLYQYLNVVLNIFNRSAESSYSTTNLILRFAIDHYRVLRNLFIGTAILAPLFLALAYLMGRLKGRLKIFLFFFIFSVAVYFFWDYILINWFMVIFFLTGLLYLLLALKIFNIITGQPAERSLYLMALLILIITPLGSNNGVINSVYGYWLAVPLSFGLLVNYYCIEGKALMAKIPALELSNKIKATLKMLDYRSALVFALTIFLIMAVSNSLGRTYRDSSDRLALRYTIEHPLLRGIHTTAERASALQGSLT